jgi:hypothetical protein
MDTLVLIALLVAFAVFVAWGLRQIKAHGSE